MPKQSANYDRTEDMTLILRSSQPIFGKSQLWQDARKRFLSQRSIALIAKCRRGSTSHQGAIVKVVDIGTMSQSESLAHMGYNELAIADCPLRESQGHRISFMDTEFSDRARAKQRDQETVMLSSPHYSTTPSFHQITRFSDYCLDVFAEAWLKSDSLKSLTHCPLF